MKTQLLLAISGAIFLLTACTTTKFTEYRGQGVVEGKGGTVRVVDGIDYWENGDPNRKYNILGVIDDSRGEGFITRCGDRAIAKIARERGGDAVIFVDSSREFHGVNVNTGTANYRRLTKVVLVKYVP